MQPIADSLLAPKILYIGASPLAQPELRMGISYVQSRAFALAPILSLSPNFDSLLAPNILSIGASPLAQPELQIGILSRAFKSATSTHICLS